MAGPTPPEADASREGAHPPAPPEQVSPAPENQPSTPAEQGGPGPPAPPAAPGAPVAGKDLRASPRYMVDWRIAVIFDVGGEKITYQGRTYDLSMNGTAMLTHNNVYSKAPVTVLLAPPPLQKGGSKKVIEIQAHQVYSVYSGALSCFRLGLNFVKFKGDGKSILKDMLVHYQPSSYHGDKLLK